MARYVFSLVAIGAFVATITAQTTVPPDCFQFSGQGCQTCVSAPSGQCGWDPNNHRCTSGTASGPTNRNDWSGQWSWITADCCSSYNTCTGCLQAPNNNCGWDGNQATCRDGNSWGPSSGYSNSWISSTSSCPGFCSDFTDCFSCTINSGCGWDDQASACRAGNTNGPFDYAPQTSSWYFNSCPSSWQLRWSVNSIPVWMLFGGCSGLLACIFFVALGRRRRRLLRQRNMNRYAAEPTVAAPLINQQVPQYGAPVAGTLVYGQAPANGYGYYPPAGEVEVYAPVPCEEAPKPVTIA